MCTYIHIRVCVWIYRYIYIRFPLTRLFPCLLNTLLQDTPRYYWPILLSFTTGCRILLLAATTEEAYVLRLQQALDSWTIHSTLLWFLLLHLSTEFATDFDYWAGIRGGVAASARLVNKLLHFTTEFNHWICNWNLLLSWHTRWCCSKRSTREQNTPFYYWI